eukprot:6180037-Alexandrium_andersonii.AAC.1
MSASLVGSEMCIRDRGMHTRMYTEARPRRAALAGRDWQAVLCASRCGPVSYTHLTLPTICSV